MTLRHEADGVLSRASAMVKRVEAASLRAFPPVPQGAVSLAVGEPSMDTPVHIRAALTAAVDSGHTRYADRAGDPELREAVAASLAARTSFPIGSGQILMTHGGSAAIACGILAIVDPAERVVIPQPTYSLYADVVRMAGAEPYFVPLDERFHLDLDAIEVAAKGAKAIVICNPSNPTGAVYERHELQRLAEIAYAAGVWLIADEAYDQIVFDNRPFTSSLELSELEHQLLYCQTFSKTYAMTGWRVGYLVGPSQVIRAADRIHQTMNGCLNSAVQRAALAALHGPADWIDDMRKAYARKRDLLMSKLLDHSSLRVTPPEGAFYAFARGRSEESAEKLLECALEHGVVVRPGTEFGPDGEGAIRISFSVPDETLADGLRRLSSAFPVEG